MPRERLAYFATSAWKRVRGVDCACPNCQSHAFVRVDRKYLVTELRRCGNCRLMYRAPSDSPSENEEYYQEAYKSGFTTDLPDDAELEALVAQRFRTTDHSYATALKLLGDLGLETGASVFDYGCSWGYGAWQIRDAGYDVTAFEISRPRAEFARRKLNLKLLPEIPDPVAPGALAGRFDCFFTCHVVEHVPRPDSVVELARALLKPGGYFVAITPNGADAFRTKFPENWHRVWGKRHPNLIDPEYWRHALQAHPMLLATSPVAATAISEFLEGKAAVSANDIRLDGSELVCVARFG